MIWALLWRSHSTLKARCVYYTQLNKEKKFILIGAVSVGEQSQAINKIWGGRKLQQVFFVLSVGTGNWTQGRLCRSSLCATPMGLRHQGPRHDCAPVNHTCKLRMSLTSYF